MAHTFKEDLQIAAGATVVAAAFLAVVVGFELGSRAICNMITERDTMRSLEKVFWKLEDADSFMGPMELNVALLGIKVRLALEYQGDNSKVIERIDMAVAEFKQRKGWK